MVGNYLQQRIIAIYACCLMCGFALHAAAAQEPIEVDPIVVTAERFPVQEKESPRFITVVSSEQLRETGANNVIDALRKVGGFGYKAYGPLGVTHGGMNSKLFLRGLEGGELILINGVPIQSAAGHSYDLNTIPIQQIERVEVLKGAASTLYGAGAMTGVVNIITKAPGDEQHLEATVEFGNQSYHNHSLGFQNRWLNVGLNYSHLDEIDTISRNFSKAYRYDTDTANHYAAHLNLRPMEHLYFNYLGSYSDTGFLKRFDDPSKADEGTEQKQYKHFADIRYERESFKVKAFGSYDIMKRDEYTNPDEPDDENKSYNYGLAGDYRWSFEMVDLTTGAEAIYRGADYNNQYGKHHRTDYALFMQAKKTFADRVSVSLGIREQLMQADSDGADHNIFLPSAGLTVIAADSLNLFANTGKAFRAPTFNNLYYESSFMVGNPDLEPESGWTYEAGLKYDHDIAGVRLVGFFMDYTDKIETDRSGGYPLTYFNAGDYHSTGIEWNLNLTPFIEQDRFLANLSVPLSGYWADPVAEDPAGEDYQAGPKLQISAGLTYLDDTLTLQLLGNFLGQRERELDDCLTLNFYGKYALFQGNLTFAVDNIFDEEVQVSGDMSAESTSRYLYYEISRLFKIGYELTF